MPSAFGASLRGGAVTGSVGSALDQNGSKDLRNLCRSVPVDKHQFYFVGISHSANHNVACFLCNDFCHMSKS